MFLTYVSHRVTDHTSILRFVEPMFDLPALTHRDANADVAFPSLPDATIDASQEQTCVSTYPPMN